MNCKIIQDLLPLYADGIASEETNEAVREHILGCGECGEIYRKMTERTQIIEDPQNARDVDYMKKIKSRWIKITAAVVGGLLAAAAIVLLCLKLFYWGFAVSRDDIDITCTVNKYGDDVNGGLNIEFTAEMKNGMALRYDYKDYTSGGCTYRYITPRAVLKKPEEWSKLLAVYHTVNNNKEIQFNNELIIVLEDTSINYDIGKIEEVALRNEEEKLKKRQ